jgi:hypothetical protein
MVALLDSVPVLLARLSDMLLVQVPMAGTRCARACARPRNFSRGARAASSQNAVAA